MLHKNKNIKINIKITKHLTISQEQKIIKQNFQKRTSTKAQKKRLWLAISFFCVYIEVAG